MKEFPGFTEHAFRIVFFFGQKYNGTKNSSAGPWQLKTILPDGTIENEKEVTPKDEGGLICYTYPQNLKDDVATAEELLKTPFVWKRADGSTALVQTWPTKFNDKFKSDFKTFEKNPNPKDFNPKAVEEFQTAIKAMFGESFDDEEGIFKFCHKQTKNDNPVYVGKAEDIMKKLVGEGNEELRKKFEIDSTGLDPDADKSDPLGFTATYTDGKGNTGVKCLSMAPDTMYTLYIKKGWETMAMVKTLEQFQQDCVLDGL